MALSLRGKVAISLISIAVVAGIGVLSWAALTGKLAFKASTDTITNATFGWSGTIDNIDKTRVSTVGMIGLKAAPLASASNSQEGFVYEFNNPIKLTGPITILGRVTIKAPSIELSNAQVIGTGANGSHGWVYKLYSNEERLMGGVGGAGGTGGSGGGSGGWNFNLPSSGFGGVVTGGSDGGSGSISYRGNFIDSNSPKAAGGKGVNGLYVQGALGGNTYDAVLQAKFDTLTDNEANMVAAKGNGEVVLTGHEQRNWDTKATLRQKMGAGGAGAGGVLSVGMGGQGGAGGTTTWLGGTGDKAIAGGGGGGGGGHAVSFITTGDFIMDSTSKIDVSGGTGGAFAQSEITANNPYKNDNGTNTAQWIGTGNNDGRNAYPKGNDQVVSSGTGGAGGGGSVYIEKTGVGKFQLNGTVTANGGSVNSNRGNGGGAGFIKVVFPEGLADKNAVASKLFSKGGKIKDGSYVGAPGVDVTPIVVVGAKPTSPTIDSVLAKPAAPSQIVVSWVVGNIPAGYTQKEVKIYRSSDVNTGTLLVSTQASSVFLKTIPGNALNFTDDTVKNGVKYFYGVAPTLVNATGAEIALGYPNVAEAITDVNLDYTTGYMKWSGKTKPVLKNIIDPESAPVVLNWEPITWVGTKTSELDNSLFAYMIERRDKIVGTENISPWRSLATVLTTDGVTYSDSTVISETYSYEYRLRGVSKNGLYSDWSNVVTASPKKQTTSVSDLNVVAVPAGAADESVHTITFKTSASGALAGGDQIFVSYPGDFDVSGMRYSNVKINGNAVLNGGLNINDSNVTITVPTSVTIAANSTVEIKLGVGSGPIVNPNSAGSYTVRVSTVKDGIVKEKVLAITGAVITTTVTTPVTTTVTGVSGTQGKLVGSGAVDEADVLAAVTTFWLQKDGDGITIDEAYVLKMVTTWWGK